jgi:hypothetical protein
MEESDDLRDGFSWLVALWKIQEVARHANGIYSSQFEVCVTISKCLKLTRKLVIITSATALMYYKIFANNNGNKKGNDVYGKNNGYVKGRNIVT